MLFYDGACRDAYIATESAFPYRPSALLVMDGLISACVAVRSRIDTRLDENARSAAPLPVVGGEVKITKAGKFLEQLSGSTPFDSLDELISRFDGSPETIDELKTEEALLRNADTSKERQSLARQVEKLDALHKHIGEAPLGSSVTIAWERSRKAATRSRASRKPQTSWHNPSRRSPFLASAVLPGRRCGRRRGASRRSGPIPTDRFPSWKTKADASCASRSSTQKAATGSLDSRRSSRTTPRHGSTKLVDSTTRRVRTLRSWLLHPRPWRATSKISETDPHRPDQGLPDTTRQV